jgi:hypothetical protein
VYADAVAETIGANTPLYRAARQAAETGAKEDTDRFYRLIDELPPEEKERLLDHIHELFDRLHAMRQAWWT